jgi:hypothetical protein
MTFISRKVSCFFSVELPPLVKPSNFREDGIFINYRSKYGWKINSFATGNLIFYPYLITIANLNFLDGRYRINGSDRLLRTVFVGSNYDRGCHIYSCWSVGLSIRRRFDFSNGNDRDGSHIRGKRFIPLMYIACCHRLIAR